ncbi:hypothetical protein MPDQ_002978 [Monascus purpureus]|uniref:Acyltransferase MbtK/IucB-like conserved domain-containing protein n=1 Tax=Monascus purpureus TaxID=5098 RepID=A0A507R3C0_MONPU|nr:hypothetical protein MPDQ_002978 [Monascus purpureus]BDD59460.1 hypothetical protein MAP00_004667 [Monascus purpureus]
MPSTTCHLPNGQTFTVAPVFGGVTFKSNDMNLHHSAFPPGWTIVIYTHQSASENSQPDANNAASTAEHKQSGNLGDHQEPWEVTRYTRPTLQDDCLYISYIVNPPSTDFKPPSSPSRQIAMMLWATLWWYFHEPEPDRHLRTDASSKTPLSGKPKGDWRINIKREGIFKGRNLMQKLERMGLIASEDSSVGLDPVSEASDWSTMFASRRSFWQLDPRIFLFTLSPNSAQFSQLLSSGRSSPTLRESTTMTLGECILYHAATGPFTSGSHLPTYFPPAPPQYTFTDGVRHPIRPKPPRQGQVFYIRYVPSVDQYISFRVPFLPSPKSNPAGSVSSHAHSASIASLQERLFANMPSDLELLHKWMNDPRVDAAWGEAGPLSKQEEFLRQNLTSRHSFPAIGCWNGRPFGYFEIYWVKEDKLGRYLGGKVDDYDRGIHVLVGEQEFRGPHRVAIWISALVHHCFLSDLRTQAVYLEPRVDNEKIIDYLQKAGFYKKGEVSFPHKQAAVMKIKREFWEAPVL